MPIKLPKITRRKSSGNALEEIPNPPAGGSSFKVFERQDGRRINRSSDGATPLKTIRPVESTDSRQDDDYDEELFPSKADVNNRYDHPDSWLSHIADRHPEVVPAQSIPAQQTLHMAARHHRPA